MTGYERLKEQIETQGVAWSSCFPEDGKKLIADGIAQPASNLFPSLSEFWLIPGWIRKPEDTPISLAGFLYEVGILRRNFVVNDILDLDLSELQNGQKGILGEYAISGNPLIIPVRVIRKVKDNRYEVSPLGGNISFTVLEKYLYRTDSRGNDTSFSDLISFNPRIEAK